MSAANKILILATGGTIAGYASDQDEVKSYRPATLPITHLIKQLTDIPHIQCEELFQLGSEDFTPEHWCQLAQRIQSAVNQNDIEGIVITHGTDTIEETACFLDWVITTAKPIILVGAMRPATARDADGSVNLYQALQVAQEPLAHRRGVLVVMQGKIFSAMSIVKQHMNALEAFVSAYGTALGSITRDQVQFIQSAYRTTLHFKLPEKLPRVEILYGYAGVTPSLVQALVAQKVAGIVYAAPGNGSLSEAIRLELKQAVQTGIIVVRASRVPFGEVREYTHIVEDGQCFISAGSLNPQKARVLLMLALTATPDCSARTEAIRAYFKQVLIESKKWSGLIRQSAQAD